MYIIIAGGGVVGFNIASLLAEEQHDVVVIEQSEEALDGIRRQLDVKTITGSAATPKTLREAEVERADLILAVTNSDETNMVTCFMAKELGAGRTAARIRNPAYSGYFLTPAKSPISTRKIVRPKSLGIDVFINPELEIASEMLSILSGFYSTPVEQFAEGVVQIREFRIEDETLLDKKLGDIKLPKPCVIAAIVREGGIVEARPEEVIKADDSVHLVASHQDMDELGQIFSPPQRPARKVAVLGGGRVGSLVTRELHRRGVSVKLIEKDEKLSQEMAAKLEGATVLQGEGTDREFLIEQGIPRVDAFVATTENDEFNILSGLLAKTLGVPRCLSVINRPGYIPIAEAAGIDVAGSPAILTARKIAHFVLSGGAISVALLEGKQLEAVEFVVSPKAQINGKKTGEIDLPEGVVIGALVHNGRPIIPPDDREITPGDHIIIISPLSVIHEVEKLFK